MKKAICLLLVVCLNGLSASVESAQLGIPFTEDFSSDNLKDQSNTNIDWNMDSSLLRLNPPNNGYPVPYVGFLETKIGTNRFVCRGTGMDVDSGDVNGDGWKDIIVGHENTTLSGCAKGTQLYLSDGNGVLWRNTMISAAFDPADNDEVRRVFLRDFTGDGNLDVFIANGFPGFEDHSLYVNDGSDAPFNTDNLLNSDEQAVGEAHATRDMVVGDFDGDGHIDFIDGVYNYPVFTGGQRHLYLNNGSATPFNGVSPIPVDPTGNSDPWRMAVADMDGDGDLDFVENSSSTRDGLFLYLNNGTANPFAGVSAIEIGPDLGFINYGIKLADINGDSHIDIVTREFVQLNNGTSDPFNNSLRYDHSADCDGDPFHLVDYDGDGAIDMLSEGRVCYNNGTDDPFGGVKSAFYTLSTVSQNIFQANTMLVEDFGLNGDLQVFVTVTDIGSPDRYLSSYRSPDVFHIRSDLSATALPGTDSTSLVSADFDGNGKTDFIVGESRFDSYFTSSNGTSRYSDTANTLHANSGQAFFTKSSVGSSDRATLAVTAADYDNDGDIDFVEGNYSLTAGQTNRIFFNDGDSTPFSGAPVDIGSATETVALASADVDHDGDVDLLEVVKGNGIFIFTNNGTNDPFNGVTATLLYSGGFDEPKNIVFEDINRDGKIDMATANLIFLNNGTATPYSSAPIEFSGSRARIARLADFNGDGWLDWYRGFVNSQSVNNGQDMVHYHTQNPSAPYDSVNMESLTTPTLSEFIVGDTRDAQIRDFNLDGKLDIYGLTVTGGLLWINNGDTATPFDGVVPQKLEGLVYDNGFGGQRFDYATAVSAEDFDYDGDVDVIHAARREIFADYNPNRFAIRQALRSHARTRANPSSSFEELSLLGNVRRASLIDLNFDGRPDYIHLTRTGDLSWKLNASNNILFSHVTEAKVQSGTSGLDLVLEDLNHDGSLDAAIAGGVAKTTIYWGNPPGEDSAFSSLQKSELEIGARAVAAADFNNDGKIDLIESQNGSNRVYLNDGTADPYSLANSYLMTSTETTNALAAADLNNDGRIDIVEGSFTDEIKVFVNNGGATPFSGVAAIDVGSAQNVNSIALADVDLDGDIDIVDGGNYLTRLFRNNGTATPFDGVSAVTVGTSVTDTQEVKLVDYDQNGWLDLLEANLDGDNKVFLNNRSSNSFSAVKAVSFYDNEQRSTAIAAADVDRDGTLDVVFAKSNEVARLYRADNDVKYDTSLTAAASIEVDDQDTPIGEIMLASDTTYLDMSANSNLDFWLSNNNGAKWYKVKEREPFTFPSNGDQLRWRAEINSLSPVLSPQINAVLIGGDSDGDDIFDPVDPDDDNDGVSDEAEIAAGLNPLETDSDNNGVLDGDEDSDGDGLNNAEESELGTDLLEEDTDDDGVNDAEDIFPLDNTESVDTDEDGIGDNSDPDIDDDNVLNGSDNCPFIVNEDQKDSNNNGIGNACDSSSCVFFQIGSVAIVCM
jgi:hypothetical protein